MTADAFGRLLYTDCRAGTGRGSGGGFQIQAQSRDVDAAQASAAVGWLLYEAQPAWVAERRPVEEFPLGFAHASAAGYGTAQGRYVGKEAVGGRQGNHLADCLLTRDPALYGSIRPAQLWRSPLWRTEPWDTTECPPFDGDLEPGLGLEEVAEWVRADARRGPLLARLLSVLEDPAGQRVVIVSADADEAMRWVAAATLLLPQRQALQVSVKVFTAAPQRAQQRLVAVPVDLRAGLQPGSESGLFVLDAVACASDEAAVTERAAFLAGRLAGDDDDPYDVMDAADLADELCGGGWPQDVGALVAAWQLTVPGAAAVDTAALFRWLRTAGPAPLRKHGPALATALLAGDASLDALRWLDAAVAAGELEFDADAIRTRLLGAEIAAALNGPPAQDGRPAPGGPPPLPRAALSAQARRDAESALTSALLAAADSGADGGLDAAAVDRLLQLAHRHGTSLEPLSPSVRDVLHAFAVDWVDGGRRWDPAGRALADEILDSAYAELRARFDADRSSPAMRAVLDRLAPVFDGRADLTDDLYCYLRVARVAGRPERERPQLLNSLLADTMRLPGGKQDQVRAALCVQQATLDRGAVDPATAVLILRSLPGAAVSPGIASFATQWLADRVKRPDAELLRVLESLERLRRVPATPPRLAQLATGSRQVGELLAAARAGKLKTERAVGPWVTVIGEVDPAVTVIRAAEIVAVFPANPVLGAALVAGLPKGKGAQELMKALTVKAERADSLAEQVAWGVVIAHILGHQKLSDARFTSVYKALEALYGNLGSGGSGGFAGLGGFGRGGAKEADKWSAEVFSRLETEAQRGEWERCLGHLTKWKIRKML